VEDQHRFILHHQVMEAITDDVIAVPIVEETKRRFGTVRSVSMDKGFHSVGNRSGLEQIVDVVVLPRKGRLTAVDRARENAPEFVELRHQHRRWSPPSMRWVTADVSRPRIPDGHFKFPHLWPLKLPQAGRSDYGFPAPV
jgi:hypothetical protein